MTKVDTMVNTLAEQLDYLHSRWQDEKDYEDFADYRRAASEWVQTAGAEFVKLTQRPFKLHFKYSDDGEVFDGQLRITPTQVHFTAQEAIQ